MLVLPLAERLARAALGRRGIGSRVVETAAGPVHLFDGGRGDGPTVVVLHGFGSSATAFAPVLSRLARRFGRVLAPEAPGHGFSPPPPEGTKLSFDLWRDAVFEVLDRELAAPAILVGNSLGGATALRYTLDRPERVRAVVVASPAGAPCEPEELAELVSTFRLDSAAAARRFLKRLYHRPPWYTRLVAPDVKESFDRPLLQGLLEAVDAHDLFRAEELARITAPVLLTWGKSERLLPASGLAFFRAALPAHAIVEEPEAVGHCPHIDDPAGFARRVIAFADALPS